MQEVISQNEALSLANKKIKENKFEDACSIFEKILKFNPNNKFVKKKLQKVKQKYLNNKESIPIHKELLINSLTDLYNIKEYYKVISLYDSCNEKTDHLVLNIVGSAYKALKDYVLSLNFYNDSIDVVSNFWPSLLNRGLVYFEIRNFQKAYIDFKRAYELNSENHLICHSMGSVLVELNQLEDSYEFYQKALSIDQTFEPSYIKLANVEMELFKYNDALKTLNNLIDINENNAIAYFNRGNVQEKLGKNSEAIDSFLKSINLDPTLYQSYLNAGTLIRKNKKDFNLAVKYFEQAIDIKPDYFEAFSNYSSLLEEMGDFSLSYEKACKSILINQNNPKAYYNKALALNGLGHVFEAIENYNTSINLDSSFTDSHFNKSIACLLSGDFISGWANYEYRRKRIFWVSRDFNSKELCSRLEIKGSTILLYSEQGLGDTIQFARYAKTFVDLGAKVILEVQRPLVGLIKSFHGLTIIGKGDLLPNFDYHLPLMSCGKILETNTKNIPQVTLINNDGELTKEWGKRLGDKSFKIGVAWEGSKTHADDNKVKKLKRSFPIEILIEQLDIPNVRLISLQRENVFKDENLKSSIEILDNDFDKKEYAFKDSVAVIKNLDLVISCDTSIAHLAGSLNVPNWIALKYVPDWRWLLGREDSPWYPNTKLFRQPEWGDWEYVFKQMRIKIIKELKL